MDTHIWPITASVNQAGHLEIGGCDTLALAREHGTPLYLLDEATFRASCRAYREALGRHYPGAFAIHYASKSLLNTAVAQLVKSEGLSLDVVSGGELWVALRAGFPAERIHLHGNAKPRRELEQALAAGVGNIVVDTLDELRLLAELTAGCAGQPQTLLIRVAPGIAAHTHAHIQTGQADSKFGLPLGLLGEAAAIVRGAPGLRLRGLHCHLGSQLFETDIYQQAVDVLLDAAAGLRDQHGIVVDEISPGGGLGVPYTPDQQAPDLDAFARTLSAAMAAGCAARGLPLPTLVIEPGRSIVARAGVALYEVLARKPLAGGPGRASAFVHVDGGMADNIRPSLYEAVYTAALASRPLAPAEEQVHVAGRYCESGDVLLHDARLPHAAPGDVLALASAGAYTLSMASNYNLVPRPALLLVGDGRAKIIQRRETYEDLAGRDAGIEGEN